MRPAEATEPSNNGHRKQMYGAIAAYRFGGLGIIGYMAKREENISSATTKQQQQSISHAEHLEKGRWQRLHSSFQKDKPGSEHEWDSRQRLKDDVGNDFPIYYGEEGQEGESKSPQITKRDSVQSFQEFEEESGDRPAMDADVDIVGWID